MTYEEIKAMIASIEAECDKFGSVLKGFKRNAIGLTSDEDKATFEYRMARKGYDMAFSRLRKANAYMVKHFKTEMRQDRAKRRNLTA